MYSRIASSLSAFQTLASIRLSKLSRAGLGSGIGSLYLGFSGCIRCSKVCKSALNFYTLPNLSLTILTIVSANDNSNSVSLLSRSRVPRTAKAESIELKMLLVFIVRHFLAAINSTKVKSPQEKKGVRKPMGWHSGFDHSSLVFPLSSMFQRDRVPSRSPSSRL